MHLKGPSSCQLLARSTPDLCCSHFLSVSQPVWSGSLGARNMSVPPLAPPQPCLAGGGGGGRCVLMLPPDAGTLYPEPRTQPWHTSHGVSMSCVETAPFSCSLPGSGWGVCQLQSYLPYLLPAGTPSACDIPAPSPRLGHCSLRLFQDWKGVIRHRPRTAFPALPCPPSRPL